MTGGGDAARRLGAAAGRDGSPTDWFDELYRRAEAGDAAIPWDRGGPHPLLEAWLGERRLAGVRAVVPGAGTGWDAELLASRGADVVAFDVSPAAVDAVRRRHPGSRARHVVADLLALPAEWAGAFDLVAEVMTVQSMPRRVRDAATGCVASLVAPGGTLLVIGVRHPDGLALDAGPPWPLTADELAAFARDGMRVVESHDEASGGVTRVRVELRRPT